MGPRGGAASPTTLQPQRVLLVGLVEVYRSEVPSRASHLKVAPLESTGLWGVALHGGILH